MRRADTVHMADWGIALIAAGSALGGSMITGWYARVAGKRQAEAARHAGDRQADALLDTVRMTLAEQRAVRVLDGRRQTYLRFLEAAEISILTRTTWEKAEGERLALQRALGALVLEGPSGVTRAARDLVELLHRESGSPDDLEKAKSLFVEKAQAALNASESDFLAGDA
ncbi:MAG: hypothetical protein ACRDNL_07355 [Spirillospora sp.]